MATPKKSARKSASKKTAAKSRRVRIYAMPTTPAIHVGDEVFHVQQDRSLLVPSEKVSDFIKMGCTRNAPVEP